MPKTIFAVYEGGVFRPVGPVDLPEHARVRVEADERDARRSEERGPESASADRDPVTEALDRVYADIPARLEPALARAQARTLRRHAD